MTKTFQTNRIKVSKSFYLDEFVPPEIYNLYGESSVWFLRPELVQMAQFIRDYFGKSMTINNWATGGDFKERGYRTPHSATGAKYSQHRLSGAVDFNIKGLTSDEVNESILKAARSLLKGCKMTTIEHKEATPTWTHIDMRWRPGAADPEQLLVVRPATMTALNLDGFNPAQDDYFIYSDEGEYKPISFLLGAGN